ncbi:MAG: hypothetical protein Q8932_12740 [Bacteroidota bacterium]|nr:hypothetical protein [Bacteroidota bacterium]
MKYRYLLTPVLACCCTLFACKKSEGTLTPVIRSSFSFSARDTSISFPVDLAFIQDVSNTQTTLISGQYADTSSKTGSISLRVIGDTTGRYRGDSLLVNYVDASGRSFHNTRDSSNFAQIDKFPKKSGSLVSGSFDCHVVNGTDSIRLSGGSFSAAFQD